MPTIPIRTATFDINAFYRELDNDAEDRANSFIEELKQRPVQFGIDKDEECHIKAIIETIERHLSAYLNLRKDENGNYKFKYNWKKKFYDTMEYAGNYFPSIKFWQDNKPNRDFPRMKHEPFNQILQQASTNFMDDRTEQEQWQLYRSLLTQADDLSSYNDAYQLLKNWRTDKKYLGNLDQTLVNMFKEIEQTLSKWEGKIKAPIQNSVNEQLDKRKNDIEQCVQQKFTEVLGEQFTKDEKVVHYIKQIKDPQNYEFIVPHNANGLNSQGYWRFSKDKQDDIKRYEDLINQQYQLQIKQVAGTHIDIKPDDVWSVTGVKTEEEVTVSLQGQIDFIKQADQKEYSSLISQIDQYKRLNYYLPANLETPRPQASFR